METKIIVISTEEFAEMLHPISNQLKNIEAFFLGENQKSDKVYSDKEAAFFLKCSTKKLQSLRNKRMIGFIRENGGRKILYKHDHLLDYLESHELKIKGRK